MGRRKGSVNKVTKLPRGVSFFSDGRLKPFSVKHKKIREFFATAEQAVARKRELVEMEKSQGAVALEYDRATHAEIVKAKEIVPESVGIDELARFWARHHPAGESPTIDVAVDQFINTKRLTNGSAEETTTDSRHVQDLKNRLRAFSLSFEEQIVSEVSSEAISQWLLSLGKAPRTIANYRTALQNFFNFAVRKQWCGISPMDRVSLQDLPRVQRSAKHALTVEQANRLLELIEKLAPQYLPHFALRLFLGFRTSEAARFRWDWIQPDEGRVYIPARATKTRDAWSIDDVPPRFWEIVKKPKSAGHRIIQVPAPYVRIWQGCNAVKGLRTAQVGLKATIVKEIGLDSWPHNTTRDTFCTLHISAYRDPQRTALILKHRNSQTLWQSYLDTLVNQAYAKAFFEKID